MEHARRTTKVDAGDIVAAAIAALAIVAVVSAAVVCLRQASAMPLLTGDLNWLMFEAA